jgi:hypothetical protein
VKPSRQAGVTKEGAVSLKLLNFNIVTPVTPLLYKKFNSK